MPREARGAVEVRPAFRRNVRLAYESVGLRPPRGVTGLAGFNLVRGSSCVGAVLGVVRYDWYD